MPSPTVDPVQDEQDAFDAEFVRVVANASGPKFRAFLDALDEITPVDENSSAPLAGERVRS